MKLETIRCNHCGGPLSVPESANFVTCNHCSSQLAIRRTESTSFTEELGEIKSNQQQMLEQLAQIERQTTLAQIDQEWEIERERYLTTNKNGRQNEPSEAGAVLAGIIAVGFGLFWSMTAFSMNDAMPSSMGFGFFPYFGLVFILFGIAAAIYGSSKAKEYRAAQKRYLRRKAEALGQPGSKSKPFETIPSLSTLEQDLDPLHHEEGRSIQP